MAKGKNKPSSDTEIDVILVVKGAGEQREDEHLNLFLNGFWPAVISLDKNASIRQVTDELEDYHPSPHNKEKDLHKHLTEIRVVQEGVEKRIWVKEAYWEAETLPSGALSNLSKEWQMSSFAFANLFQDIIFSRNTKKLKEARLSGKHEEFMPGSAAGTRLIDHIGNYFSYLTLFFLVFAPFATTLVPGSWLNGILLVLAAAAVWALAPAIESSRIQLQRYKEDILKRMPALPGWVLAALLLLLISNFTAYIQILLLLLGLQTTLILSRRTLWKYRKFANTDVDLAEYYSYQTESREMGEKPQKHIGKVDEFWLARFPVSPLMYRYLVFLALPIGFVAILLVRFLKWTRVLGGLGEALDGALHTVLVGYLDDVADYAMDPAQSHRVRSAVKDDILYFHRRPEVKRIHVIAHSQGTPITYETLFRFLEIENQKKIYTYLTIGGVLSYYNQAREIFDAIYYNRFPVDVEKEQGFHPDFRWMNFWNFTDPITEFYGLDEYTWFEEAPPLDKTHRRTRTTPRNIRTRSSLLKNHGEYWSNIEQINLPFAKRVLGETRPKEWDPESINPKNWHHAGVLLLWLILLASLSLTFYYLFDSGLLAFVTDYFAAINIDVQDTIKHFENLFLPKEGREASLIEKVASLVGSNSILELWQKILGGLVAGLAGVAVIDWVSQITRAFGSTQGE